MVRIKKTNILLTICIGTLFTCTPTLQGYAIDTYAAFVVPALITSLVSSKRTVADVRAKAQTMIDDYEQKHAIFSVADINWAYKVIKSTDQELASMLWWNNLLKSTIFGAFTALVYHSIMHPNPAGNTYNNCHFGSDHSDSTRYPSDPLSEIAAPLPG